MKTSTLKKSILDYAIKGELSAKFRRENPNFSAFDEIEIFNKNIEKQINELNKKLDSTPKSDKENLAKLKAELKKLKKIEVLNPSNECKESDFPFKIPKSWAWVKLGDICEILLGKTPQTEIANFWNPADYKWVSINDMSDKETIYNTKKHISEFARQKYFGDYICKKGTLILSFKLTIGRVSIMGFDGYHNEGIASILPYLYSNQNDKEIFQKFLLHFLIIFTNLSEKTGAIKGDTLNKTKLNELLIPLPPLQEQKEIVKILDSLFAIAKGLKVE